MIRSYVRQFVKQALKHCQRQIVPLSQFGHDCLEDAIRLSSETNREILIFDVGANVGGFALQVLEKHTHAKVISFEPFPESYNSLTTITSCYPTRAVTHGLALSDQAEPQQFHINQNSETNSLLANAPCASAYVSTEYIEPIGQITVPCNTLDAFCANEDITAIDILKIDTQGSDLRVLHGGSNLIQNGCIRTIMVEVLFVDLYEGQAWFTDIFQWLSVRGFQLVGLYDPFRNPETGAIKWADALFTYCPADSAVLKTGP